MPAVSGVELLMVAALAAATAVVCCGAGGGFPASVLALERAFPANQSIELEVVRARDRARHARILQTVVRDVVNLPVLGSSDVYGGGLYFTKVKLGYPPKEFNVQIDTGSDILWVTCNTCNDCPQSSQLEIKLNFYDAASSSTASLVSCSDAICASIVQTASAVCIDQTNQCGYSFQYDDGSGTSGYYVSDLLHFDMILGSSVSANTSASIVFGCSTHQTGDLTKTDQALDGILGFGQQGMSVISQLSLTGIAPKVFSHCLRGEGNGGGFLVLGEVIASNVVYTPLVLSQAHYNLYMHSIAVNGQLLPIDPAVFTTSSNRGTIVDSGTTLAYLIAEAYDPLVSAVTATVSQCAKPTIYEGNQCYLVSNSITEVFTHVTLNFEGGASMVLKPADYLVNSGGVDGEARWCIGFQRVQDPQPYIAILGDLVLKDKVIIYDLASQRIGWADYDCSMTVNFSMISGKDEFINSGQLHKGKLACWLMGKIWYNERPLNEIMQEFYQCYSGKMQPAIFEPKTYWSCKHFQLDEKLNKEILRC